ncbi:hypothetical protein ABW20_dc0103971 [Dactylellina cionopaga]|nr:hypothetical protein ABW20_dc0103971 [Dactylellina cionopaga]
MIRDSDQKFQQHGPFFSVGLRAKVCAPDSEPTTQLGVEYSSEGYIKSISKQFWLFEAYKIDVFDWQSKITKESVQAYAFNRMMETSHVIGCGINSLDGKIFFTRNGKMLPRVFQAPIGQQFPIINTNECNGLLSEIKMNFGRSKFAFDQANTPGWIWDEQTPDAEELEYTLIDGFCTDFGWGAFPRSMK